MGVRKNSFVVNSIISHFPVKWEVFLLNFFKRQSCLIYDSNINPTIHRSAQSSSFLSTSFSVTTA